MATLARMQVELVARSDRYVRDMRRASSASDTLRAGLFRLQSAVLLLSGTTGLGLLAKRTFELGASVEETGSKFRTVFGESSVELDRFLDNFANLAGLSQTQAREVLATTGSIVQGMGLAQEASAAYSREVVKLAGDLSSFNNVPVAETARAIQSAVTGERESLKRLGIVILETDVQKRSLALTGKRAVEQLTQEEKAVATLALISERAGVAVGDLARTQDSAANRARRLSAGFRDIREALAAALLPVFNVLMGEIENLLGGTATFVDWLKTSGPVMAAWAEVGVAAFKAVGGAMMLPVRLAFQLGMQLGNVGRALFALITQDWQAFHTIADQIEQSWVDMGESFADVGTDMLELYDKLRIAMNTFGEATLNFTRPALDTITDGAEEAADAVDRLAAALSKLNAVSSLLGGLSRVPGLGFLGGLASVAGIAAGVANPAVGLAGAFAGAAAGTSTPGVNAPIAGFGGLSGDPGSASVASSGLTLNVNMSAPTNPLAAARDGEWQRALAEGARELIANGFRFA